MTDHQVPQSSCKSGTYSESTITSNDGATDPGPTDPWGVSASDNDQGRAPEDGLQWVYAPLEQWPPPEVAEEVTKRHQRKKEGPLTGSTTYRAKNILNSEYFIPGAKVAGGLAAVAIIGGLTRYTSSRDERNFFAPTIGEPDSSVHATRPSCTRGQEASEDYREIHDFELTLAGIGKVTNHPKVPGLYVEVTMIGFQRYAFAIDWLPKVRRIIFTAQEIPISWTSVRYDKLVLPLELRRRSPTSIECRWL